MPRKKKNVAARGGDLVKSGARAAVKVHGAYAVFIERTALVVGFLGFVAVVILGGIWLGHRMRIEAELPLSQADAAAYLALAVFCASFIGFLLVNDGQGRIDRRIPNWLSTLFFGVLPLGCLLATVFAGRVAEMFSAIDPLETNRNHPFWLFVRFYPLALTALCLFTAFKATTKPRKYMLKGRALKFLLLAAPYVVVMVYSELSLKSELVESGVEKTLGGSGLNIGALGINLQLILALMTGSRLE